MSAADSPATTEPAACDGKARGAGEPGRRELVCFSLADPANGLAGNVTNLANQVLVGTLGVSPAAVGVVMMVRGLWDAVTDPAMGYFSDNFRHRLGRRRPFIVLGGVLMALALSLMWWFPQEWEETPKMIWFGAGLLLFATAQTIFSVPYGALSFELSPSYHGRTRVQMYRTWMGRVGSFAGPYLFPFCLLAIFSSALEGVRVLAMILGVVLVLTTVVAAWGSRERAQASATRDHFLTAIRSTMTSPEFIRVTFIYVCLCFTLGVFGAFQFFLVTYYVFGGDLVKGAAFGAGVETFANVLILFSIPAVGWLCRKFQKHNALKIALWMMIVGSALQMVLINPQYPGLMFISPFFYSLGIVATFTILGTLMADAVDADELRSGQRREGLFSAAAAFMMKTVGAVAAGISGWLIQATGFVAAKGGDQAEGVFHHMLLMFSGKGLILLLCLVALHKYPLTEERVAEIQAELRRRKAPGREG